MAYHPFSHPKRPTTAHETIHQKRNKNIVMCDDDLPDLETISLSEYVAIDTETNGLNPHRDRLCLVQITFGSGPIYLVRVRPENHAPNLIAVLTNPNITKIFHFARFDIAMLYARYGILTGPIYCTKIASFLARTYTDRHGLKELCRELLGVELSKYEQSSDWGKIGDLTDEQKAYAASDVCYLHALRNCLNNILERENRAHLLHACLVFLPHQARLDVEGWGEYDIFSHQGNKK